MQRILIRLAPALLIASLVPANAQKSAQKPTQKSTLGTVNDFRPGSLQIGIRPDEGGSQLFAISNETDVVRVAPGEHDLTKAQPARIVDLAMGDRILVSFVDGMKEARRIVLISADDITKRNEAIRADWEKRGISGMVAASNGGEIQLDVRSPSGARTVTVMVDAKTAIRRYAPDSIKFAEAQLTTSAAIAVGDQFRARGEANGDGSRVAAQEVVFGTFLTKIGAVIAVNREASQITIEDVETKQPVIVKLNADSSLKMLPDMRAMLTGGPPPSSDHSPQSAQPAGPKGVFDIAKMFTQLPKATLDDLRPGAGVVVTSTRGARTGEVTAIMLLANADFFLMSARSSAEHGKSALDGINQLHGGMFGGPAGPSLPAIIP